MSSLTCSGLCQLLIILLSVEFSAVSCDTFYIVESPSSPCPGQYIGVPCLTLQQYAANPGRGENITFLVEPGVYSLSTVLTVSDGYNFTISSTDVTVTCISATASRGVGRIFIEGFLNRWHACTRRRKISRPPNFRPRLLINNR